MKAEYKTQNPFSYTGYQIHVRIVEKHHDFFRDEDKNPRIATAITYLNEDFEGGETSFPLLNITIKPEKGSVLYFEYNNEYKDMTLHSGDKVKSGTKYIATSWIRENYADTDEFY